MGKRAPHDFSRSIVGSPNSSSWVLIVLSCVLAASVLFAYHLVDVKRAAIIRAPSSDPVLLTVATVLLTSAAVLLYWTLHARMEATDNGLRWRQFGRWTSVRWDEITDYYLISTAEGKDIPVVQAHGRAYPILQYWTHTEKLLLEIAKRTTQMSTEGWVLLGCRPCEISPQEFVYETARHRRQIMWGCILPTLAISLLFLETRWDKFAQTSQSIGGAWAIAESGFPIAVILLLSLLIVPLLAPQREALSRTRHRIETNGDGISFDDGKRVVIAAWCDVTAYQAVEHGGRLKAVFCKRLETAMGSFEFTSAIQDYNRLCRIIDHWLPEAAKGKAARGEGVIGGAESLWTGGRWGDGEQIHHYRTDVTRGLMLVYGLFVLAPVFSGIVNGIESLWSNKFVFALEVFEILLLLICYCAYRCAAITLTDDALTQRSPLRMTSISWTEIIHCECDSGWTKVSSHDKTIRFSPLIADWKGLMTQIERRVVNSETKGWATGKPSG